MENNEALSNTLADKNDWVYEERAVQDYDKENEEIAETNHIKPVEENSPIQPYSSLDNDNNDCVSAFNDIDVTHQELLGSITKAKQAHDTLTQRISNVKAGIEKKQKEKEILKINIQEKLDHQYSDPELSLSDELNIRYIDVREENCAQIISYAEKIGYSISSDFDNCESLFCNLDKEVGLLKSRIEYIKTLKALDSDIQLYKEYLKKEEEAKKRFQTLAEIFRLGIQK